MSKSNAIQVGKRLIGPGHPVFVIAEVGINHNGNLDLALQLIYEAFKAGADAVKFQKRTVERVLTRQGLEMPYNSPNAFAPTYGEHRRKLEFNEEQFSRLKAYADSLGIIFTASAWDEEAADLMEKLGTPVIKVASADITNLPLIRHIAYKGIPLIVSTGMCQLEDIDLVVSELEVINPRFVLLHTTSCYPCDPTDVNLRMLRTLARRYKKPVGYSGHEIGAHVTTAAIAMGACCVEKHFTLDKTMKGSDHAASLTPDELRRMVINIRAVERALGSGKKRFLEVERKNATKLQKSIVTTRAIRAGEVITRDMLTQKGPGGGILPIYIDGVIGRRAAHDVEADVLLAARDVIELSLVRPATRFATQRIEAQAAAGDD
ncbi:MAG: N-acetylneuraminate synthase family protein [Planctomycetes bacterium]|nr:N-acetylneuraminate synthase family protein [Planctomycetota bacterium]